mmetsp:Transcript_29343/g.35741  ORF Transcript_29343/g.35741 Transcript_29343/m.35741 type:complete len:373 (+) Transcript_29343:490-1608(+)
MTLIFFCQSSAASIIWHFSLRASHSDVLCFNALVASSSFFSNAGTMTLAYFSVRFNLSVRSCRWDDNWRICLMATVYFSSFPSIFMFSSSTISSSADADCDTLNRSMVSFFKLSFPPFLGASSCSVFLPLDSYCPTASFSFRLAIAFSRAGSLCAVANSSRLERFCRSFSSWRASISMTEPVFTDSASSFSVASFTLVSNTGMTSFFSWQLSSSIVTARFVASSRSCPRAMSTSSKRFTFSSRPGTISIVYCLFMASISFFKDACFNFNAVTSSTSGCTLALSVWTFVSATSYPVSIESSSLFDSFSALFSRCNAAILSFNVNISSPMQFIFLFAISSSSDKRRSVSCFNLLSLCSVVTSNDILFFSSSTPL